MPTTEPDHPGRLILKLMLRALRPGLLGGLCLVATCALRAQELEPALYQNAPVGLNAAIVSYGFSMGNILLDSSLPVEDADARIHTIGLGYLRTLDCFGRAAKLDVQVPVSWGRFEGTLAGERRVRTPSGLADPRVRLMAAPDP
jgi:hypothetical protein